MTRDPEGQDATGAAPLPPPPNREHPPTSRPAPTTTAATTAERAQDPKPDRMDVFVIRMPLPFPTTVAVSQARQPRTHDSHNPDSTPPWMQSKGRTTAGTCVWCRPEPSVLGHSRTKPSKGPAIEGMLLPTQIANRDRVPRLSRLEGACDRLGLVPLRRLDPCRGSGFRPC